MRRFLSITAAALLLWGVCACSPPYRAEDATVIPLPTRMEATMLPSPEPTPTPTPEITPVPSPSPTPDAAACDAYYRDTVFVGDSLTVGFFKFVRRLRREEGGCLDGAAFAAGEGVSVRGLRYDTAPETGTCLLYDEERVSVTEGIRKSKKSHVVILLGTNDFGGQHAEDFSAHYTRLLDRIEKKCTQVTSIALFAVPPVTEKFCQRKDISAEQWNAVNDVIRTLCEERGYAYLSFAEAVSDAGGYLDPIYSSDGLLHLNENGFRVWLEALRAYAMEQMRAEETANS